MKTMDDYMVFLAAVRKDTGIEALTSDETGLVTVNFDGKYNANLQFVAATGRILCFVEVAQLPADTPKDVYRDLPPETLRAALRLACNGEGTRGAFLGLFGDALLLSAFVPMEGLAAPALADRVLAFADAALAVRAALAAPAAEASRAAPPTVAPGGSAYLQV